MRKNQGITLIALIITIIVMLILVGVVVTVVIQSDLLGTAKKTGEMYKTAYEEENKGEIEINGKKYSSIEEYTNEVNSNIQMNYKIEDGFIILTVQYVGEIPTVEKYMAHMKQKLAELEGTESEKLAKKQLLLLDAVNFRQRMDGNPEYESTDKLFAERSWEDFVNQVGSGNVDQALLNFGICPEYRHLIVTMPDGTIQINNDPPLEPFEVKYAIKQTGEHVFIAEVFGKENSKTVKIQDEGLITIVEGNIEDWGFRVEDDDTITITEYKNTDKTIDTVVIPNFIGGKPVKRIEGGRYIKSSSGATIYFGSIWNYEICQEDYYCFGSMFYRRNLTIKKIIVSEGIETIGYGAFTATENLKEIILPSTVLELGEYSLGGCVGLTEAIIPNSVIRIGGYTFVGCTSLTEVIIPSSVTTMQRHVFNSNTTVHVPWKEGEKPEGWVDDWADSSVVIDYAK